MDAGNFLSAIAYIFWMFCINFCFGGVMLKNHVRILVSVLLLAVLALSVATPVAAFDGRGGDEIVIGKEEVVNDDLYVGASNFTMDGTVKGDVLASGEVMTINGTVEGDVMAAGQTVIINGNVTGSVRMAGAVLFIGENAKIGGDVIAAGASIEIRKGSSLGQDAVIFGGQALLAGDITRNVKVFTGGTELRGIIGGNVEAEVGEADHSGPSPMMYIPQSPIPVPDVKGGLTIDPAAKIGGKLTYTSAKELSIPGGVVAGAVTRLEPVVEKVVQPTASELFMAGLLNTIRKMVSLILLGLLLGWLFPTFISLSVNHARTAPLPSFGWGIVSIAAFFFALLVLIIATIVGALLFGVLTLKGLSATIVFMGLLGAFVLIFGFVLAMSFVAQIIISILGGKLILEKVKPEWVNHKVWPLVIGVFLFAILTTIPILGWLAGMVVVLLGLGALWIYGKSLVARKPAE
jgi:cytoskeletal protein CcmA (bactofilin family)